MKVKDKFVATMLALFLGGAGIHRLYLGQRRGLLYLCFCWTFIPTIIAIFDFFSFVFCSEEKWQKRWGKN